MGRREVEAAPRVVRLYFRTMVVLATVFVSAASLPVGRSLVSAFRLLEAVI